MNRLDKPNFNALKNITFALILLVIDLFLPMASLNSWPNYKYAL